MLTVSFNPPPGWPDPPSSWVPADDWLPEPEWPDPPVRWTFWTMDGGPDVSRGLRDRGRRSQVSFPVATVAAQSTVSLAALFPERGGRGRSVHRGYGSSHGSSPGGSHGGSPSSSGTGSSAWIGSPYGGSSHGDSPNGSSHGGAPRASGVYERAGREYYRPRGSFDSFDASVLDGTHALSALEGTRAGADPAAVLDSTLRAQLLTTSHPSTADPTSGAAGASRARLSPVLRLVTHPSGFRVQFLVGGAVAAALAELMRPTLVAGSPDAGAPGRVGEQGEWRAPRGGRDGGDATGRERGIRSRWRRSRNGEATRRVPEQGIATIGASVAATAVATGTLLTRALAARRAGDRAALARVEGELRSLHRQPFRPLRPPAPAPRASVTAAEEELILRRALDVEGASEPDLHREALQRRREVAVERAAEIVRATRIARWVLSDRRRAIADGAWRLLREHDPATVVAVVDEAMRLSGSDVTCLDAGHDPSTGRPYVTVLVRFPPPVVVADEVLGRATTGKSPWRPRTVRERNLAYASGLASAVLAAVKQVDTVAVASDVVHVVVVRPTPNGRSVEPIYVGTLDREESSLRHPDADPMPLVLASAVPEGFRVAGPEREVVALERSVDPDGSLTEIVDACRAAIAAAAAGRLVGESAAAGQA
ncbi:hypothetical protein [Intrasporangium sp. YIM S08009]|uniref:hypothetical protein n=1 Tax=Intrasporangium zincisolvens TaxID=3080018 RepID=UPI002B05E964|nr:hypothetical protein [Intrasporangium sp. YIM S08009]